MDETLTPTARERDTFNACRAGDPTRQSNSRGGDIGGRVAGAGSDQSVGDEAAALLGAVHHEAREGQFIPADGRILLAEELFDPEDVEALRTIIDDTRLAIMPSRQIVNAATNMNASHEKLACVVARSDFNALWKESHQESNKATLIVLEDNLCGERFLYLEALVGLAGALMARDAEKIRRYSSLIFEAPIDDSLICLLDDNNPIAFALKAILKFRKMAPLTGDLESYKKMMQKYLVEA